MELLDFEGPPLKKVTCTSTKCDEDKHCFRPEEAKPETLSAGNCHACNVERVDWPRVHQRNFQDVDYTFESLKQEYIRHTFWTIELDPIATNSFWHKGLPNIEAEVIQRLNKSVLLPGRKIFRDGTQTAKDPKKIICCSQHATATCCRKCIKYWHDIPYERELKVDELDYLKRLMMSYIKIRIPDIPNESPQLNLFFNH